ncbi:MAG: hypothetical protein LUE06_04660 [Oscillospiraceae bacterium]|nr:hypothetical protein [Oscillospiraceae bacterium]
MKRIIAILLLVTTMLGLTSISAFGDDSNSAVMSQISRDTIDELYENKSAFLSDDTLTSQEEEMLLQEIINQIQTLLVEENKLKLKGVDTSAITEEIANLESRIDQMTYVVCLNDSQLATLMSKPSVPAGSSYVGVYGVSTTGKYNGITYDVFNIYAYAKKLDGTANPLAYSNDALVLMTDNTYTSNTFLQTVEATAKFILGLKYTKFSVADFVLLSKFPSFFDTGATQKLTVDYVAQQTFVFSYVSEKGLDSYTHIQTTEQLGLVETFIATSTKNGVPTRVSQDYENTLQSQYYANANNAAQLYATGKNTTSYYVGSFTYYVGGVKKATVSTVSYPELYSIPGL